VRSRCTSFQKYLNFHYSVSLDLFGSERSTNAANYFTAGLKGRWNEERRRDDHKLTDDSALVESVVDGQHATIEVSALNALNHDLRDQYIADCETGVRRWNRILSEAGLPHRLALPHIGFNRRVGAFAGTHISPQGDIMTAQQWEAHRSQWLPNDVDKAHVISLMQPVYEPGKLAAWIAPPRHPINGKPFDFEYVHLA
jgi:benzoyl-CoA 2,3-dioxygenase component B